jgi:serine/threonine protein kinase
MLENRGSFSVVYKATDKVTKKDHAVKVVDKQKLGAKKMGMIETEVAILLKVNHPNIIKLEDIFETQEKVFIIMEM